MSLSEIQLGSKTISTGQNPFFIAEIGINHNGDVELAKKMIDNACAAGWDCVKFQKRTPDIAVPEHQKSLPRDTPWGRMTYLEYKKRIEFEKPEYDAIDCYCKEKGIQWTASPWDVPSLDFLVSYNPPFIKLPSAMLSNTELLEKAAASGIPIILSTGMSSSDEIDSAVKILEEKAKGNYILLHTTSSYPSPVSELNLSAIGTLAKKYGCLVGYSGHELGILPSIYAILSGAMVVERHITLDKKMWGTDQKASIELDEMYQLRKRSDELSSMLGDGVKKIMPSEVDVRKKLRGS